MRASDQLSLRQRVLNAGMWSLAGFALSMMIRLGSNLVMTRLLVPEMFGVMAVASTVMIGLTMLSDVGLKQSVIQSRSGDEPAFLNTAWSLQIVRGIALWIVALCLCLSLIAANISRSSATSVYANPNLPYVVAVLSISVVIAGFESTKLYQASRGILLGQITIIDIIAQIIGLACMLGWVAIDRSIWALVAGSLGSSATRAILSHSRLPGVANRWEWDRPAIREIVGFGKWIMASSTLGFLVSSGDRLLLAGLVNSTVLGYYAIASLFVVSADAVLSKIMTDVSFPAFSEVVRSQVTSLKQNYYRFLLVIASAAYFTSGFLMTSGQALIDFLYDQRYASAGWMLQVLSATLLTVPFRLAALSFLALGKPRLQSYALLVRLVLMLICIPVGFKWYDIEGALAGYLVSQFSSIPIFTFYNFKHRLLDLRRESYLLAILPVGLAAGKLAALCLVWLHGRFG